MTAVPPFAGPPLGAPPLDRRRFLQVAAATLAAAGLAGCDAAPEEIVPAVYDPPRVAPGEARSYATAVTRGGYATGVLVRHGMGHPVMLEGNPDHPASLGAVDPWTQAALLDLFDPARARVATLDGQIRSPQATAAALIRRGRGLRRGGGAGLRVLTGAVTSPTLAARLDALRHVFPALRRHQWEAAGRAAPLEGAALAFGRPLEAVPRLAAAAAVLAVDSDLFDSAPGHLAHARAFAERRATRDAGMPRLYAIESTPTLTGAKADHRRVLPPHAVSAALRTLAGLVGAGPQAGPPSGLAPWLAAVAEDLLAHKGAALVHAGPEASAADHAVVFAINAALGAIGHTLTFIEPVAVAPDEGGSLAALMDDMRTGRVDTLLILGGDPVYAAPADLEFERALRRVPFSLYLGAHVDATAAACRWHLPLAHALERWGDASAFDGTATLLQPQVRRLFDHLSPTELLAMLAGDPTPDDRAFLRDHWRDRLGRERLDEGAWTEALRRGTIPGTASPTVEAAVRPDLFDRLPAPPAAPKDGQVDVLFRPDPALWDGRYAANGWLQELPRPLTKLVWGNAALLAPATARRLGLVDGDMVELRDDGRAVRAPVLALPGQAEGCVTLPLGHGRRVEGAPVTGFDATPLRTAASPWRVEATLHPTGGRHDLVIVQEHDRMEGRDTVRTVRLADLADGAPKEGPKDGNEETPPSLYPGYRYEGYAWGMAIDLTACIGCGACVVACQAENNIPVVGRDEVMRTHTMHWLRIDLYRLGDGPSPDTGPDTAFGPVPCMHCENAPCEVVCPVQATVHDGEGLNAMIYNRCVGTRFCSNNCPYKVRRFNFHDYAGQEPRPAEARNPEVTVRARGVMEKCTYCVQRIRLAHIAADREGRAIRDGEVVTACQSACPTRAITFGDINDADSAVSRRKADPLDYALLEDLNTRPRTTYAARVVNPNPKLAEG